MLPLISFLGSLPDSAFCESTTGSPTKCKSPPKQSKNAIKGQDLQQAEAQMRAIDSAQKKNEAIEFSVLVDSVGRVGREIRELSDRKRKLRSELLGNMNGGMGGTRKELKERIDRMKRMKSNEAVRSEDTDSDSEGSDIEEYLEVEEEIYATKQRRELTSSKLRVFKGRGYPETNATTPPRKRSAD